MFRLFFTKYEHFYIKNLVEIATVKTRRKLLVVIKYNSKVSIMQNRFHSMKNYSD